MGAGECMSTIPENFHAFLRCTILAPFKSTHGQCVHVRTKAIMGDMPNSVAICLFIHMNTEKLGGQSQMHKNARAKTIGRIHGLVTYMTDHKA